MMSGQWKTGSKQYNETCSTIEDGLRDPLHTRLRATRSIANKAVSIISEPNCDAMLPRPSPPHHCPPGTNQRERRDHFTASLKKRGKPPPNDTNEKPAAVPRSLLTNKQ